METIQQKFAMFMSALTPEEQRAVVPLMATFITTISGPQQGAGPDEMAPPPPPPGAGPPKPPVAPPPSAIPGGPALPPPDPAVMSIGRQQY